MESKEITYLTQNIFEKSTFPAKLQHQCSLMLLYTGHSVILELGNYPDLQKFKVTVNIVGKYYSKIIISVRSRHSCNT